MIRIAIVDDKLYNRKLIADKLFANVYFQIVFEAVNGQEFLDKMRDLAPEDLPHIVLMDIEMPVIDGIVAIATGSSLYPGIRFVVLTIFDDDEKIFKAIRAGACGYLLKEESGTVLIDMLMNLQESGAGPISPSIAYKILQMVQENHARQPAQKETPDAFDLSKRELEVLNFLSQGDDYKQIAEKAFLSPNTVKKHIANIYQKLHVNSKAQALRIAYSRGLID